MATTMFGGFSSSDRRKKVVYGKSSRPSAVPPSAPEPSEDAPPSPERPRKQTALKDTGGALKIGNSLGNACAKADSGDIFDIPSEDEFQSHPKPTRKLVAKLRTTEGSLNPPAAQSKVSQNVKKVAKPAQPLRKPEPAKPNTVPTKSEKPAQLPKPIHAPLPSSNSTAPRTLRAKTPQPSEPPTQAAKNVGTAQTTAGKAKATLQRNTSAPSEVPKTQNNAKTASALPTKKLSVKPAPKPTQDLGVFDVPSSEDEAPATVKKVSRPAQAEKKQESAKTSSSTLGMGHKESPTSDDSSASNKRKRKGSVSSTTGAKPSLQLKPGSSAPQRSRKSQKKESDDSPGYAPQVQSNASANRAGQSTASTNSKPKRTRQRTVPVLGPPKATKGQSSPAMLTSMLPNRQPAKPSPVAEAPRFSELEDQTMYDIPDPMTTPVRAPKAAMPGSTTPRQKTLFGGLLGDSSLGTPMPSISSLQLTDKKPKSLIGSLSRSKSDLTHSTQARKTRLIDTLKPAESSSDEDEDESSEDDGEAGERHANDRHTQRPVQAAADVRPPVDAPSHDMDVDGQANADSQTSQGTTGFGMRPKLTYAMSRSYLRENNPEDDLMMSMDLGDDFGPLSQAKDTVSVSEDDADPTSQAQAHHELKSRGRNYVFQQEAQTMIEDISNTTSASIRRSAMIELCTKMADETFCSQLLDSPLAHQFFRNVSKGGEIIFEFATAVVMIFILRTHPNYTVLDQILDTGILVNLSKLIGNDSEMQKIAKDRKTNLSKIAKESVLAFRDLVQQSCIWSPATINKVTPQLVSIKAVELLVMGLRKAGNSEPLVDQKMISQLVEIATASHERLSTNEGTPEDEVILLMVLSTLESVSATRQKQAAWSSAVLQRIANFMPRFLQADAAASTMLAVKLCMNLTNNKPKACQSFSAKAFVQPLVHSIIERFESLNAGPASEKRTETLESLILSLGATINLAEFSDQMRLNADDDKQAIERLVEIFLEGSERASQANSVEESHSGVAIGYLAVLLGNLCLNDTVRSKVRMLLPGQGLMTLIDSIKEFVRVHEHVDKRTEDFEGAEGQEALQTYTARLMLVVERLQSAI